MWHFDVKFGLLILLVNRFLDEVSTSFDHLLTKE